MRCSDRVARRAPSAGPGGARPVRSRDSRRPALSPAPASRGRARRDVDLPRAFYLRHPTEVARDLLGMVLLVDGVGGRLVEVEAYHESEPASHAFVGPTPRNRSLFLEGGHVYVYRIHQVVCANVSCGPAGTGAGVLFRAIEPTDGVETIAARRAGAARRAWTDGPGKLCRALAITLADDGQDLLAPNARVRIVDRGERVPDERVVTGPRVGISKAVDLPWRFRVV